MRSHFTCTGHWLVEVELEHAGTPLSLRNRTLQSSPSCQTVQIPILPGASLGRTKDQHTVTIACHLPSCCHHAVRIWAQALKGQSAHLHKYQSFCTNQPLARVLISVLKVLNVSQIFACDDLVFKLWRERSKMTHI